MKTSPLVTSALFALALFAPLSARATITPAARTVVERYLEVSGGRAAWERTRTLHFSATISVFGLKGRVESWRKAPDQRSSEVAIGPFNLKDWTHGEKAWRTDPSGKLLVLDGKDLAQAVASSWFENERWLDPDQGGGAVTAADDVKDSLGTRAVLEVTPPAGKPRRFEFDRKTGLLVRGISKNDQMEVRTTSSDYRKVGGFLMAFKTVQEVVGAAANTATITADSVSLADVPGDRFLPPAAEASRVTWLGTPGTARLPFTYRSRHVWVRASVNGGPLADFIYDTGASVTVIDSAYAASIGLATSGQVQAQGAGSSGGASFAAVSRLRLEAPGGDGVELRDLNAGVLNLNSILAPFFWRDCAGIIGFDVIVQFVNEIDFDGKRLTLYEPKNFAYAGQDAAIPMTLAGHAPVVNIKVDGQYAGAARIDVGSGSTLDLHTPFVAEHGLIGKNPGALTVTGGGFGGTFESRLARMQSIEIGPHRVDQPLVGLSTTHDGALASEDYAGNLGNRLLERFKVTLDYERRLIYLTPGARFSEHESFSRFGAQLAKVDGAVRAAQVLANSPAAAAGLKEGDLVVSIDGIAIGEIDPDLYETKFDQGKPGAKMTLVVTRDGKRKNLKATLREIL